jgi:hypothetical protein
MSGHEPIIGSYVSHDFAVIQLKMPVIIVQQPNPTTQKIDFAIMPFGMPLIHPKRDIVRSFSFNVIVQVDECSEAGIVEHYIQATSSIQRAPAAALDQLKGKTGVPR